MIKYFSVLLEQFPNPVNFDFYEMTQAHLIKAKMLLTIQFVEQSETAALFNSLEEVVKIIFIIASIAIMMLTPLFLSYSAIDKFFDFRKFCVKLSKETVEGLDQDSKFRRLLCQNYRKSYANYLGNLLGIGVWVVLSMAYAIVGGSNVLQGLKDYFNFPFDVIREAMQEGWVFIESDLYTSWMVMLGIVIISLLSFVIGRWTGEFYANKRIHKLNIDLVA
jgi:hypothetical protein